MAEHVTSKTKVYGIVSLKGGVGKTTTVANLGSLLARNYGMRVLAIDGNFYAPNLGLHFGLVDPNITLYDVMAKDVPIKQAIYVHESGLHIIPTTLSFERINTDGLHKKLEPVVNDYDIVLMDTSPNLSDELASTILASDELIVLSSLDYPTISTTIKAIGLARDLKTKVYGVVLCRVRGKKYELSIDSVRDSVQCPLVSVIPEDEKVLEALAKKKPVVQYAPNSPASKAYKKLVARMMGIEYKEGFFSRLKSALGIGGGSKHLNGRKEKQLEAKVRVLEAELEKANSGEHIEPPQK